MSPEPSSPSVSPPMRGELHEVQRAATRVARIVRPSSWKDALLALRDHPGARPVAGGTDLLLDLARSSGPAVTLVDLSGIEGASRVRNTDSAFILGGGVTHNQIVADERIRTHCLPLAQACLEIGSPQLRNRATLAGNLATASPANDSISALMALDATVVLSTLDGDEVVEREVAVGRFFTGFRTTVCEPHELITAIRVPRLRDDERGLWVKVGLRKAQAISVVHAGMVLALHDGKVSGARLALGSVAPTVITSHVFPAALEGKQLNEATISAAASAVAASIEPIDDVRATADYRTAVTEAVVGRALRALADDRQADAWPVDPPVLQVRTPSAPVSPPHDAVDDDTTVSMTVNGQPTSGTVAASTTLLDWLRDQATPAVTGVKEGCAEGECGACTVRLDGAAVMGCLVAAAQADGADVVTVEGLAADASDDRPSTLHPLQTAFIDEFAVQCGFCIPGFLVAGATLLDEHPMPSDDQIESGLAGNLCRCTGYYPITEAVHTAATRMGAGSARWGAES